MYCIGISSLFFVFTILFSPLIQAQTYSSKLCAKNDFYHCYIIKKGDSWQTLFSTEEEADLVMRLNRTNNALHPGMKIAVPKKIDAINKLNIAPFATEIPAPQEKVILISLNKLAWGAYEPNGRLENWGPISGGKGYCSDIGRRCNSPRGNFVIYNKGGAGCTSSKFPIGRGGAPMPYCMFFYGGFALHGSPDVPGYHASHGCIRLFTKDAKWLNQEFTGKEKVRVIIDQD